MSNLTDPLPTEEASYAGTRDWPHAPPHRLGQAGVYFVTARTRNRVHFFNSPERLTLLQHALLAHASRYGWRMEAWAVLANHYHFVAHSPAKATTAHSLVKLLRHVHGDVSRQLNRLDGTPGRECWQNYRETHLTFQRSYLARLNYTHNKAVHHLLVRSAADYEWCSALLFEQACTPAWIKTIQSFQYDEIARDDDDG